MTDEEADSIREWLAVLSARAANATPGPWTSAHGHGYQVKAGSAWGRVVATTVRNGGVQAADDAAFIAHARADVPELVALVERLLTLVEDQAP